MNAKSSVPAGKSAAARVFVALFMVLIFTRFGGLFSLPPGNISAFWPANALLFAAVFLMPGPRVTTSVLAVPVYAAAELWIGYPLINSMIYALANVAEVCVLLGLLRAAAIRSLAFENSRDLFILIALALPAAFVGGGIGALGVALSGEAFGVVLLRWSLADFFGYCLVVPLVLSWGRWRHFFEPEKTARKWEAALLLAALLLISALSSGVNVSGFTAPLGAQFLPMPLLLWAALRFGPPGGAIATIIVASTAFFFTTRGIGLFAIGTPEDNVESLQLFFAALVVSVMTIASLNAERRKSFDTLHQEVTDRRLAENALRESEENYRRLSVFQRGILDHAASGIISTDPEGRVTSFNRAAERLLDYAADEIVGKQTPLCWHDPEELARHASQLSVELGRTIQPGFDVFTARPQLDRSEEGEWTFIRKDGTRVPVLLSVTALRDQNSRITGFLGVFHDLTERKRAEEEIRQLNRELEQRVADRTVQLEAANRELEAFAYSVSHDLRAPLRHIDGFVGLLRRRLGVTADEQVRHYMTTISDAVHRTETLIEDLLSFSRMGRKEMSTQQVNLSVLVQEVIRELEPEVAERKVNWRVTALPAVSGDRAMLRVVFMNLISNALKFTRPRKETEIEIGYRDEKAETVVYVRDNGVGFDMKFVDKLFGVFQRLHGVTEFEGTGIGLANVRRVISRHGGRAWAEGKIDGGATFYFSLPRAA